MMMSLTEEEKSSIEQYRTSQYSVAKIIDRLVAENEELKLKSIPRTTSEIEEMLRVDKVILQSKLSLSVKREKIYRKALEEILFFSKSADRAYNYLKIQYTVQTALNEGKEVK